MASKRPIIVEGPDGGGKTQLAKQLAEIYNLQYRRPPADTLSSTSGPLGIGLVEWWDEQLAQNRAFLNAGIYDRCYYISDPIYQQAVAERGLLIPGEALAEGIMKLWSVEPIIIFCLPPLEVQLANVRASGRERHNDIDEFDLEKISNAYWAYYAMWANSMFESVKVYDYTVPGSVRDHLLTSLAVLNCEEE